MGFGNNPFVSKAQVAEQKAQDAGDAGARERAWRDAARLWERAAEREMDARRRTQYEAHAGRARTLADTGEEPVDPNEETPPPAAAGTATAVRAVPPAHKPN